MNTEVATEHAIQDLLKRRLSRFGFDRAEIDVRKDHSGDPALFIDAYYEPRGEPVETDEILRLLTEIRDLLVQMGEQRFPYLRHHLRENQQLRLKKRT
jgi:hypothetical protein